MITSITLESSKAPIWRRTALLFLMTFFILFYAGAFYGFSPMALMLEENGAFADLCNNKSSHHCEEQSSALETVYFVAFLFAGLSTPAFGSILDRCGPVVLQLVQSFFGCFGIALLFIYSFRKVSSLLYLAFISIGFMVTATEPLIMSFSYLFTEKASMKVTSFLNCLYGVGGGLGYWVLFKIRSTGVSFTAVIGYYLLLGFCVFGVSSILWIKLRMGEHQKNPTQISTANDQSDHTSVVSESDVEENTDQSDHTTSVDSESNVEENKDIEVYESGHKERQLDVTNENRNNMQEDVYLSTNETSLKVKNGRSYLKAFLQEAKTYRFMLLTGLYSLHIARAGFILATAKDFLRTLGDEDQKYLTMFSLCSPLSLLALPLVEVFFKWGDNVALQMINLTGVVHGIIMVVGRKNLNIQVLGFIVFAFYEGFNVSIIPRYLLKSTSNQNVIGMLTGVLTAVPALVQLLNIPLCHWAGRWGFFWPNLIYLLAAIPLVVGVTLLRKKSELSDTGADHKASSDVANARMTLNDLVACRRTSMVEEGLGDRGNIAALRV